MDAKESSLARDLRNEVKPRAAESEAVEEQPRSCPQTAAKEPSQAKALGRADRPKVAKSMMNETESKQLELRGKRAKSRRTTSSASIKAPGHDMPHAKAEKPDLAKLRRVREKSSCDVMTTGKALSSYKGLRSGTASPRVATFSTGIKTPMATVPKTNDDRAEWEEPRGDELASSCAKSEAKVDRSSCANPCDAGDAPD